MKRMKQILVTGILAAALILTAACGGQRFDASAYVKAFMDMMTKGEVKEFMDLTGQTEEEAKSDYTAMTDAMMEALGGAGVSEDVQTRFRDLYIKILARSKYTVGEAEKTDDGYKVDVAIEPITGLYDGLSQELQDEAASYAEEKIKAGEEINESDITDWIFNLMLDKMEERVDSLSYGEAQTITVELVKDGDKYKIKDEEAVGEQIGAALIDTSGLE